MKPSRGRAILILGAVLGLASVGLPSANAMGSNSWQMTPGDCNTETVYGSSVWLGSTMGLRNVKAQTSESGNFCWNGNHQVSAAVRDNWGNAYSWAYGANLATSYYPLASYDVRWGGWHGWGNAPGRST